MESENTGLMFTNSAEEEEKEEIVFVAGGELGPVKKWVTDALKKSSERKVRLFFGADTQNDLDGYREVEELTELTDNFDMVTALNSSNPEWEGEVGLITDVVRDYLNPDGVSHCFLYGTDVMVEETEQTLTNMGVPKEKIHRESFEPAY